MKKIIQLIGGIFVAAILVIAVTAIYQNKIIPELKTDAFKSAEKKTILATKKLFMKQYLIIRYLNIQEEQHKKQQ